MDTTPNITIGVLTQNVKKSSTIHKKFSDLLSRPHVAVSYIEYLESLGTKVLVIDCRLEEEQLKEIYYYIDGLVLPGGSASLTHSEYARCAKLFRNWAIEDFNEKRRCFPIFGICLGFEFLLNEYSNNCLSRTETRLVNLPIKFCEDVKSKSKLYEAISSGNCQSYLEEEAITYNSHKYSFLYDDLETHPTIKKNSIIVATSVDSTTGQCFVAAVEDKTYPFYGLQWHPEKNEFEEHKVISHSQISVLSSRRIGKFFVEECLQAAMKNNLRNNLRNAREPKVVKGEIFDTRDLAQIKEILVL